MAREDDLLARFRDDGHAASMEALVEATRPRLIRVAARIGAPQDAEDSVQATYHALLRRPQSPDDVVGFLVATAVRIAYRRKANARRDAGLAEKLARPGDEAGEPSDFFRAEEEALVRAAVHRLPRIYRDAVVLHHLEGLPLADVAKLLDVPVATAKTRVQRGRALLRGPLSPLAAHAFLFVPWTVADLVRGRGGGAAAPLAGRWLAAAVTVAVIAAGAAIVARGRADAVQETTQAPVAPTPAPLPPAPEPAPPPPHVEDAPAPAPVPAVAAAAPAEPTEPAATATVPLDKPDPRKLSQAAIDAAKRLGVSDHALQTAWAAALAQRFGPTDKATKEENAEARKRQTETLAALKACGDAAFPAVVAVLRGGGVAVGPHVEHLIQVTMPAGREQLLIDACEDKNAPEFADFTALGCLGLIDSPQSREYLLSRLERETDSFKFVNEARSLGRLHDPRGFALCKDKVRPRDEAWNKQWVRPHRGAIAYFLPQMDKERGREELLALLAEPTFDVPEEALESLGRQVDGALAKSEAEKLIAAGRLEGMTPAQAKTVRRWADWKPKTGK